MRNPIPLFFLLVLSTACQQNEKSTQLASNEVDAGRKFLRAAPIKKITRALRSLFMKTKMKTTLSPY